MDTRTLIVVAVILTLIIAVPVTFAAVYYTLRLRGSGTIRTIGLEIYGDPDGSLVVTSLEWGTLDPGAVLHRTLYFKSTSSISATMTMHIENWSPAAVADFITLSWNYDGSPLSPGEIRPVILTLALSSSVLGISNFSFDYVFVAGG